MNNPDQLCKTFKALAHKRRWLLFSILLQADKRCLSFGQLQNQSKIPAAPLSHHLKFLVDGGLLIRTEKGAHTWFQLSLIGLRATFSFVENRCMV